MDFSVFFCDYFENNHKIVNISIFLQQGNRVFLDFAYY